MAHAFYRLSLGSYLIFLISLIFVALPLSAVAQSPTCSTLSPSNSVTPTVASGYQMALVATGLSRPRSIQFDTSGNLLVVEQGKGISWINFGDQGGACLTVGDRGSVIDDDSVGSL